MRVVNTSLQMLARRVLVIGFVGENERKNHKSVKTEHKPFTITGIASNQTINRKDDSNVS